MREDKIKMYKSIFLSDIHLGTRGCKIDLLLDFLRHHETEKLVLVGDIIDLWKLRSSWFWPNKHNDFIRKLIKISKIGTKIIFVPGNHDEFFRQFIPISFGDIDIVRTLEYDAVNGKKYIIMHGDEFDFVIRRYKWLAIIGSHCYDWLIRLNTINAWIRDKLKLRYWSLSKSIKYSVKDAIKTMDNYEVAMAEYAKKRNFDGVICGHIHNAQIKNIQGIEYLNCGDWVESCTAITEDKKGNFKLIEWLQKKDA